MSAAVRQTHWIARGSGLSVLLLGGFVLGAAGAALAAAPPAIHGGGGGRSFATVRQPFHVVRTLGALQERIAQGDEAAIAMQREVVQEIADELQSFPPAVWQEPRNRQALIKFALSGGDPELLRVALSQKLFTEAELPLAEGALAYAEGHRSTALQHLEKVDVFTLPPSLAGHVALVKAIVVGNTDLARVIRLSDEARLLSPGTLVEETAMRLAMEGAIARADRAKFEALASRYFRRFPRSPYLSAVIRPVATAMVENGYAEKPDGAKWVHGVMHYLDPQKLVQFYAALAEIGLRSGKLATTVNAARVARKYARQGSPEHAWTQAYEGAALVIGLAPEDGLLLLNSAEASGVSKPVGELITGARAISHLIRSPPAPLPEPAAKEAKPPLLAKAKPQASNPAAPAPGEQNPVATKVRARIAQIDKMLKDIDE
jgi:chemotaxis protein MotC